MSPSQTGLIIEFLPIGRTAVSIYEKLLCWLLRIMGGSICLAFFAIFLPLDWMHQAHQWLGLGEPPQERIFEYLARSTSAMYLAHGVVVLFASTDVRRHRSLIYLLAFLNVFLGASLLITDLWAGMPGLWTLSEGPMIIAGAGFVLWLLAKGARGPRPQSKD